jgi:tetratricopeptide (TPR) repeat protein
LAASPRYALAHHVKGQVLRAQNRFAEAIPEYETVIELDRNAPGAYANLGWCKFLTGSIEEAIPALEQALRLSPHDHRAGNWCARIGPLKGASERAAVEIVEARRLRGEGSVASVATMAAAGSWGNPKIRALLETTFFAGLRKAGVPEE